MVRFFSVTVASPSAMIICIGAPAVTSSGSVPVSISPFCAVYAPDIVFVEFNVETSTTLKVFTNSGYMLLAARVYLRSRSYLVPAAVVALMLMLSLSLPGVGLMAT